MAQRLRSATPSRQQLLLRAPATLHSNAAKTALTQALNAIAAAEASGADTPVFVVDVAGVRRATNELRDALPNVALHYAYKACPLPDIANTLIEEGVSFEIASFAELSALIAVGADADNILYSNPIKSPPDIGAAYAAGVRHFCVDSLVEVEKVASHAPGSRVYVRLAVDNSTSVFPLSAKFGADSAMALEVLLRARSAGLVPWGITFHVGSQCLQACAWTAAIAKAAVLMDDLAAAGIEIAALDIGGGFPAKYQAETPSLADIGLAIEQAVEHLPYPVTLFAEPGRVLVAHAANAVSTVIGRASRRDGEWLYLDIGVFTGVMEALEEGEAVRPPLVAPDSAGDLAAFTVAGPTCDQADTIARGVLLPAGIAVGDRVVLLSAGAYSMSYTHAFCGFSAPSVAVVDTPALMPSLG